MYSIRIPVCGVLGHFCGRYSSGSFLLLPVGACWPHLHVNVSMVIRVSLLATHTQNRANYLCQVDIFFYACLVITLFLLLSFFLSQA